MALEIIGVKVSTGKVTIMSGGVSGARNTIFHVRPTSIEFPGPFQDLQKTTPPLTGLNVSTSYSSMTKEGHFFNLKTHADIDVAERRANLRAYYNHRISGAATPESETYKRSGKLLIDGNLSFQTELSNPEGVLDKKAKAALVKGAVGVAKKSSLLAGGFMLIKVMGVGILHAVKHEDSLAESLEKAVSLHVDDASATSHDTVLLKNPS